MRDAGLHKILVSAITAQSKWIWKMRPKREKLKFENEIENIILTLE